MARTRSLKVRIPASARRARPDGRDVGELSDSSSQSSEVYSSDEGDAAGEARQMVHKPEGVVTDSLPGAPWPSPMCDSSAGHADAYYTSTVHACVEWAKFCLRCTLLLAAGPYVALQIFACNVWNEVDARFLGLVPFIQRMSQAYPYSQFLVKHRDDGFISHLLLWLGVVLRPGFSTNCTLRTRTACLGIECSFTILYASAQCM